MNDCPSQECRDNLKRCLSTKITKATIMWGIGIFFVIFGISVGLTYNLYSNNMKERQATINSQIENYEKSGEYKYSTRKEYSELKENVSIIQNNLDHIRKTTDRLDNQNKQILDLLKNKYD